MRCSRVYHFYDMAHATGQAEDLPDINTLVATNLQSILGERTPEAYCRERPGLFYVSGTKKGKRVSPRALRYAVEGEQSPRLDLIAAVAYREQLHPYQLLFFEFDPKNAPVMISRSQETLIRNIREAARYLPPDVPAEHHQPASSGS